MSTLATGDRLKHKTSGNEYTVTAINPYSDIFVGKRDSDGVEVEFDLDHIDRAFEVIPTALPTGYGFSEWLNETKLQPKCECGVDKLGAGLHSSYCPKVGVDNA